MAIYCSQIYQTKPNLERNLTYDIIAYYVELGNQWPPSVDKDIPQKVSFVPIEKFLPDFFVEVYIFHGGYECVTIYERWNDIRKKFALYQSPYTCPRYLQRIYHEILLPYERQRKTLEQSPPSELRTGSISEIASSLLGYTLKLVTHSQKENVCWKWGTIVSYHMEKKLHQVILDDGRNILLNLEQVHWQLGAWNPYATMVDEIAKCCFTHHPSSLKTFQRSNQSFRLVTPTMDKEETLHQEGQVISILATGALHSVEEKSELEYDDSSSCWEESSLNKVIYPELDRKPTELQRFDIVRCPCGWQVDTGDMVECSVCKTWSHKYCIGVNPHEWDKLMESDYKCFMCHPSGVKKVSQEQWSEHIHSVRQLEWTGLLSSLDRDAYEAMDDTGMGDYHPVFGENPQVVSTMHQSQWTPKLLWKTKKKNGRERCFRRDSRPAAPPFVRVSEKEKKFLDKLRSFWESCSQPLEVIPMFRGKPFDFYALYEGVKRRGGFKKVVENKQWPEIWKTMRNYYKESTDHSYQLKRYFEKYLRRFMEEYPIDEEDEVEETAETSIHMAENMEQSEKE
ncbi:AT-rich interactive domain-containing protein 2 [Galdieria sulphuraria]|nr:AT-rich interactive domain-containing protein 2 [Galdieria sulphuraria]